MLDRTKYILRINHQTENGNFLRIHIIPSPNCEVRDMFAFMTETFNDIGDILENLHNNYAYKLDARMEVSFVKHDGEGNVINRVRTWLLTRAIDPEGDYHTMMSLFASELATDFAIFSRDSSGWTFEKMHQFDIHQARYHLTRNRGRADVPPKLPPSVAKQSVVVFNRNTNPKKNIGENCFIDAISVASFLAENEKGVPPKFRYGRLDYWRRLLKNKKKLKFCENLMNIDGVDVRDIYKFENDNPRYFVTVITTDGKSGFYTLRQFKYSRFKYTKNPIILNILYYNKHYFAIRNLDRLLSGPSMVESPKNNKKYYCNFCLNKFKRKSLRDKHMEDCTSNNIRKVYMPDEGSYISFDNYVNACQHHPFVFYADSECYQNKIKDDLGKSTEIIAEHVPLMMGFYLAINPNFKWVIDNQVRKAVILNFLPEYPDKLYFEFRGENCVNEFMDKLVDITERLQKLFAHIKIEMNDQEFDRGMIDLYNTTSCYICGGALENEDTNTKGVIDHCHWTGNYRGIAHNKCNINIRQQRRYFPVIFHNFRGYDCHVICRYVKLSSQKNFKLGTIPLTKEKYLSLSIKWKVNEFKKLNTDTREYEVVSLYNEIRFLDSFQFLSSSLETLMDQLGGNNSLFYHLGCILGKDTETFNLAKKKGVYPYTYIDSLERLSETKLPSINHFCGGLNDDELISTDKYKYACDVWEKLSCQTLWDYTSFYQKVDIVGLADVFEKFRTDYLSSYGLDPVFFYSLPGFAWAAMLKRSQVNLEQMTDYDMFCFYEQSIRGGLTQVTQHYAKADNIYTNPEEHSSPNDLSRYLLLLDANSLYAWAMTQPLPYDGLEWLDENEVPLIFPPDLSKWPDFFGEWGYTLEVDLDYPKEIQDLTESYPLAPGQESVDMEDYSVLMLDLFVAANPEKRKIQSERKLVSTHRNKRNYIVHYRVLHFYLSMGLTLVGIHSVVKFKQRPFMREYINYNISERGKYSADKSKSDYYKKLNNAVFGKTQEQQRKHINFVLEYKEEKQLKLVGSPLYKGSYVFQDNLVGFYMAHKKLKLRHPIYVGSTILDLSKLLMFYFYYKVLVPTFKNISVMYTDTDSLLLNIHDCNIEEKLKDINVGNLDSSNLSSNHPLYNVGNKGKLGFFKDEMDGIPIDEVVCLRPKMYAIKSVSKIKKTAKGINKTVVRKTLNYDDYYKVYIQETKKPMFVSQVTFK